MKPQRFEVGDIVTYKDTTTLPGRNYRYGGANHVGFKGKIVRYNAFMSDENCYSIEVTSEETHTYTMLESEFEEYDSPVTNTKPIAKPTTAGKLPDEYIVQIGPDGVSRDIIKERSQDVLAHYYGKCDGGKYFWYMICKEDLKRSKTEGGNRYKADAVEDHIKDQYADLPVFTYEEWKALKNSKSSLFHTPASVAAHNPVIITTESRRETIPLNFNF